MHTSMSPIRTRWQQNSRRAIFEFSEPLKDTHDGLRGFELKDADGVLVHELQFKLVFGVAELVA